MKGMQLSNLGLIGVHQYVLHETVDKKQLTFISGKSAFQPYLVFIQLTQHILPAILYKVSLMLEWASKTQIARKIIQLSSWLGPMVHSTPFCKMADSQILLIFHITRIMKVKLINIKKKKNQGDMHLYFFIQHISPGLGQNKVTSSDFQKGTSSISD